MNLVTIHYLNIHVICFISKIFCVLQNMAMLALTFTSMHVALHGACEWMRVIRALMHRWANTALAWVGECIHPLVACHVSLITGCYLLHRLPFMTRSRYPYRFIQIAIWRDFVTWLQKYYIAKICISLRKFLIHMTYIHRR